MSEWKCIMRNPPSSEHGKRIWAYGNGYQFEAEADEDGTWCNLGGEDVLFWRELPEDPTEELISITKTNKLYK